MENLFKNHFKDLSSVNSCLEKKEELSKTGKLGDLKEELGAADQNRKQILGKELNILKKMLQEACDWRIQEIQKLQEKDNFEEFDPTFFSKSRASRPGKLHPISLITKEIVSIFQNLGFEVVDGPLVATQENNFTLLNMPSYHPARAMQDTFFLAEKDPSGENYVLRTHTTSLDIPYAKSHKPPFRMVAPGKVFRNENIDATHDIMFHQIECLLIDRNVSLAQLKTLAQQFFSQFFNDSSLQIRLRPSYFPYTIPSMEVDMSNPFKNQRGNRLEGQEWIEAGGSGLLHPTVIRNMGLDPNEWGGLAFGFGIDRMAQLKLGISGITQFFEGSLDFLEGRLF